MRRRQRILPHLLPFAKIVLIIGLWEALHHQYQYLKGFQERQARRAKDAVRNAQKEEKVAMIPHYMKFNKETLSTKSQVPKDVWWRSLETIPIWTIWIGNHEMIPLVKTAMDTCRRVHADDPQLEYRVVTEEDVQHSEERLGFKLHPSYYLLDEVEKTDYLRGELLHYHGGFYMDGDMLCLKSFREVIERSYWDFSGAQDKIHYGEYPSLSQNSLGPVRPNSTLTSFWHEELHRTMDNYTIPLKECEKYYNYSIPYTHLREWGTSICGVGWGDMIDFIRPAIIKSAKERLVGHELRMCDVEGKQVGWYNETDTDNDCHIVHLGTSGEFLDRHHWTLPALCDSVIPLNGTIHCKELSS